jgi:hypothetical protein
VSPLEQDLSGQAQQELMKKRVRLAVSGTETSILVPRENRWQSDISAVMEVFAAAVLSRFLVFLGGGPCQTSV